ncbi:MAG: tetratricopeptide repeat protein [Planctomycetes bacterium]|nr:tetratricopeptide repeat protein [Planctomycetota bacterium]
MPPRRASLLLASVVLAAAGVWAYANGLRMPFLYDDVLSIVQSPNVRHLWPPSESLTGPAGSGASGRPLVALSLALDHAIGGLEPFAYRLTNVALHVAAGLALFAAARRVLAATRLAPHALGLAFAIALLWLLHPLQTDALDQVVYRNETLAALFLLLAFTAADRVCAGEGGRGTSALAALAMSAAMASKEMAVAGPLLVLLWDRTRHAGSFAEAWRARKGLHLALAASWLVLALAVASGDRGASVGLEQTRVSSLDYLRTQTLAIPQYLRLALWPRPLRFDYSAWPIVRAWGPALAPGAFVLALVAASLWAVRRKHVAGFLGVAFFALLAPSSSVVPLSGEWIAEHRMVLPLACVLGLVVPGAWFLLERACGARAALVGALLLAAAALPLGLATRARHADYASAERLWGSVLALDPDNARAHHELAQALAAARRPQEALAHAQQALQLDPELVGVYASLGSLLLDLGRASQAVPFLVEARRRLPGNAAVAAKLGAAQGNAGDYPAAEEALRAALALDPAQLDARTNLALVLLARGRPQEAAREARAVLQRDPGRAAARSVLQQVGE